MPPSSTDTSCGTDNVKVEPLCPDPLDKHKTYSYVSIWAISRAEEQERFPFSCTLANFCIDMSIKTKKILVCVDQLVLYMFFV